MDSNPSRARYAENKKAFVDVIGDPFAYPEPVEGWYGRFKQRSVVGAVKNNFDEGHGTGNAARPSQLDFFCDVEKVVEQVCDGDKKLLNKFYDTYIVGETDPLKAFTQDERNQLEQRIGKLFRAYHIAPVSNYFKTLRRPNPTHIHKGK